MRRIKRKLELAPFKPREVFLRNVEFAASFDDHFEEFNLHGAKINFFEYFGLDFIIPGLLLILICFFLSIFVSIKMVRYLTSRSTDKVSPSDRTGGADKKTD